MDQLLRCRHAAIAAWSCIALGGVVIVAGVLAEPGRVFPVLSVGLALLVSGVVANALHELRPPPERQRPTTLR